MVKFSGIMTRFHINKRTIVGAGIFSALAAVVVIIGGVIALLNNQDQTSNKGSYLYCHNCLPDNGSGDRDAIVSSTHSLFLTFNSFDPQTTILKASVTISDLQNARAGAGYVVKDFIQVTVNDKVLDFKPRASLLNPTIETSVSLQDSAVPDSATNSTPPADPAFYPLDKYVGTILIFAYNASKASSGLSDIRTSAFFSGTISGFTLSVKESTLVDSSYAPFVAAIDFTIARSKPIIFFSIFISILQWVLALSLAALTAMIVWRGKNALPACPVAASMLFALPGLRNAQPGAPTVGTSADLASFFWAMAIVSICLITLLLNVVLKDKRPKPSPLPTSDPIVISKP